MKSDIIINDLDVYAKILHAGQKRKGGEDYANHVMRVAYCSGVVGRVSPWLECYAVGVLHDSLECCDISLTDIFNELIKIGFKDFEANNILYSVNLLTKRENYDPVDYLLKIKKNNMARIVKLADLEDNMRDLKKGNLLEKYKLSVYILNS